MATIASLDIGTAIDTAGIGRGLSAVEQQLAHFGSRINGKSTGSEMAEEIISGLQQRLEQAQGTLQESLVNGLSDPAGLASAAERASAEYMTGLKKGLGRLAAQGLVTDEVRQQFEVAAGALAGSAEKAFADTFQAVNAHIDTLVRGASFSSTQVESIAGLQQAETALQASLKTTTLTFEQRIQVEEELARVEATLARSTRDTAAAIERSAVATREAAESAGLLGRFVNTTTGEFTALGRRGAGALVGISFALDGLAQSGGGAENAMHSILRTVATLAPAFGAEGLIVSAVAAGTDAIISIFTETRGQMEKTQDDFEKRLRDMQNTANTLGLEKQLQAVQFGEPGAGLSKFSPDTGPLKFYVGSLKDLRSELADIQGQLSTGSFSSAGAVRDLQEQAGKLRAQIEPLAAQERALTQAILDGAEALREPSGLQSVTTEAHAASGAVDDLVGSLARGMAQLQAFERSGPTVHLTGVVDAIRVPADLPEVKLPVVPQFENLDALARNLADLTSARQAVQAAGLGDETARRTAAEARGVLALTGAWRGYVSTLVAGGASAEELAAAAKRLQELLKAAGIDASKLGLVFDKAGGDLGEAANAAHHLGDAFGSVGDRVGDVIGGVSDLRNALDTLKGPDLSGLGALTALASGAGAITSVVGALGSLLGPSPAQQAHDRILEQNNQALATLAASLDRFGETAASVGNVQHGVAAIVGSDINFRQSEVSDRPTERAREILARYGLTLEQVNKIAKDNGLTLLDHGRVVDDAFTQLAEALGITADILTRWGQTFDAQRRLQELSNQAHGIESTPQQQVTDILDAIDAQLKFGLQPGETNPLSSIFEGLDESTATARAQLRSSLAGLIDEIQKGDISLEELGGFANATDFGNAIGSLLDGLDAMDSAVHSVADSLLNVPKIFKLARVRFESALPETPDFGAPGSPKVPTTVPPEPGVEIPPLVIDSLGRLPDVLARIPDDLAAGAGRLGDVLPPVMRDALDGATFGIEGNQFNALLDALRATVPAGGETDRGRETYVFEGDINVDARTKSVDQALDEIVEALRRRSRAGGIPLAGVRIT